MYRAICVLVLQLTEILFPILLIVLFRKVVPYWSLLLTKYPSIRFAIFLSGGVISILWRRKRGISWWDLQLSKKITLIMTSVSSFDKRTISPVFKVFRFRIFAFSLFLAIYWLPVGQRSRNKKFTLKILYQSHLLCLAVVPLHSRCLWNCKKCHSPHFARPSLTSERVCKMKRPPVPHFSEFPT